MKGWLRLVISRLKIKKKTKKQNFLKICLELRLPDVTATATARPGRVRNGSRNSQWEGWMRVRGKWWTARKKKKLNSGFQSRADVSHSNQVQAIRRKPVGGSVLGEELALMCVSCDIKEHKCMLWYQRYQCISIDLHFRKNTLVFAWQWFCNRTAGWAVLSHTIAAGWYQLPWS